MKFVCPTKMIATYKITTPMFLGGGGDSKDVDEKVFRVASFKGALRFWWRALNWGYYFDAAKQNESEALILLHDNEARLFGSAVEGEKGSQGLFDLKICAENLRRWNANHESGADEKLYLLGMGLAEYDKHAKNKTKIKRPRLAPGALVNVHLNFKSKATSADKKQIAEALQAFGYFGGLGSRSRRGYGSMAIQTLKYDEESIKVDTKESLKEFVSKLYIGAPGNAPLSAVTSKTRIDISLTGKSSGDLMAKLNDAMQLYRSYGAKDNSGVRKVRITEGPVDPKGNFVDDHNIVFNAITDKTLSKLPKRAIFGLPHNYKFSNDYKMDIPSKSSKYARRSSPLLIHIHQFPTGEYIAIQTFLSSRFFPKEGETNFLVETKTSNRDKGADKSINDISVDDEVIHNYLDFNDFFQGKEVLLDGQ